MTVSLRERLMALRHDYARAEGLRNECEQLGLAHMLDVLNTYGQIVAHLDALLALETPEPTCGTCQHWARQGPSSTSVCGRQVTGPDMVMDITTADFGCNQWAARATAEQE